MRSGQYPPLSELAALHLFEEMVALQIGFLVGRRRKCLVVPAATARFRELLRLRRILPHELRELLVVHENLDENLTRRGQGFFAGAPGTVALTVSFFNERQVTGSPLRTCTGPTSGPVQPSA